MNIYLKIVRHIPEEHSVIFRYYTDAINEEFLAQHDGFGNINRLIDGSPAHCRTDANLNIFDTSITTEDELKSYITKNVPPNIQWFKLQESILKKELNKSIETLRSTEGKTFTFDESHFQTQPETIDIESLLNQLIEGASTNTVNTKQ